MDNFSFFQFIIDHLNYAWVWFLMMLESTVIPVPSELVVTPAAYFAHAGKDLNTWWVIVFATIGADCGATINYLAGYYLGRPLIYRFANSRLGRLCLLTLQLLLHLAEHPLLCLTFLFRFLLALSQAGNQKQKENSQKHNEHR